MDAVELEVTWQRLLGIANEAAAGLFRAAFSVVVRDGKDFNVVISDEDGNVLAQSSLGLPAFTGVMKRAVQHMLSVVPREGLRQGDHIICNDPWNTYGHLNDIAIVTPLFHDGQLVGYCGSSAHVADVGGMLRGLDATNVHEEGLFLPPFKILEAGVPNDGLLRLIRANVRVPDQVIGDIFAQIAAGDIAQRRVSEMLAGTGRSDLVEASAEIRGRSAAVMERAIEALPDGSYHSSYVLQGLPYDITLKLRIDVAGNRLLVDFDGTTGQIPGPMNCTFAHARAYTLYALKCVLDPGHPANEGTIAPVEVVAPEGCIVNAMYPAAVLSRHMVSHHVPAAVFAAMSQAAPHLAPAASGAPSVAVQLRSRRADGRPVAESQLLAGGMGARPTKPGTAATYFPSNVAFSGIEMLEHTVPVIVRKRARRDGSGGAGRFSGGDGQIVEYEARDDEPLQALVSAGRFAGGAPGRGGAADGAVSLANIDGAAAPLFAPFALDPGKVLHLESAGGGGIGACTPAVNGKA